MKKIDIRAPFYGAGSPKQFDWVKDGYHIYGLGLKIEDIVNNKELEIGFEGNNYLIKTEKIKEFVKRYKSFYTAKGQKLGVFSKDLLTELFLS